MLQQCHSHNYTIHGYCQLPNVMSGWVKCMTRVQKNVNFSPPAELDQSDTLVHCATYIAIANNKKINNKCYYIYLYRNYSISEPLMKQNQKTWSRSALQSMARIPNLEPNKLTQGQKGLTITDIRCNNYGRTNTQWKSPRGGGSPCMMSASVVCSPIIS